MVTDVNRTHCGHHFAIRTNTRSFCRNARTNIRLYDDYTSIKKKEREREPRKRCCTEGGEETGRQTPVYRRAAHAGRSGSLLATVAKCREPYLQELGQRVQHLGGPDLQTFISARGSLLVRDVAQV